MLFNMPRNQYEWISFFTQLSNAYKIGLPNHYEEIEAVEACINAFIGDYPNFSYQFNGKKTIHKRLNVFIKLLDDVSYPYKKNTLDAAKNLIDGLQLIRLTGSDSTFDAFSPVRLTLDPKFILENSPNHTIVGLMSTTASSPISSSSMIDNADGRFYSNVDKIKVLDSTKLDFEADGVHSISFNATLEDERNFSLTTNISVLNQDEAPTDIVLSSDTILENKPAGSIVGFLSGTDPENEGVYDFSIQSDPDSKFQIGGDQGDELQISTFMDYEVTTTHDVTIRATEIADPDLYFDKTFTINVNALWTPTQIATRAWYDASDESTITQSIGKVSEWRDKSGNLRHLGQLSGSLQPTTGTRILNNENVLDFNGSNFLFINNFPIATVVSVFMVAVIDAVNNASDAIFSFFATKDFGLVAANASQFNGDIVCVGASNPPSTPFSGGPFPGPSIYTGLVRLGPNRIQGWVDGTMRVESTYTGAISGLQTLRIFSNRDGLQQPDGAVAEVVIVTQPTTLEHQKIEGYLAHKWGLNTNLPVGHPYKNVAPIA